MGKEELIKRDLFVLNAANFCAGAKVMYEAINKNPLPSEFVTPLFFLLGHSCELILKVRLLDKGANIGDLRGNAYKNGHGLIEFKDDCLRKGISFTGGFLATVDALDPYFSYHAYKYLDNYVKEKSDCLEWSLGYPCPEMAIQEISKEIKRIPLGKQHDQN